MLAYFDCFSGISGDMTLGAFLDLGVQADRLRHDLSFLPIESFEMAVSSVEKSGLQAVRCQIVPGKSHSHRRYADIRAMIDESDLPASVKISALSIFRKLALAESGIHGRPVDDVHFHEVGAVDAIVDIVGCCLSMNYLGITQVAASALPQGHGFVDCHHGRLPLPAPATLSLLKDIPVYGVAVEGELVTPTGAAIIATLGERFGPMPPMTISAVGYGAGSREYASHPNLLRIVIGTPLHDRREHQDGYLTDTVHIIETTIDDMNPEVFGYLMEELFARGALDVYWIPVYMKKNRPGTLVQILTHEPQVDVLRDLLFSETTSIGMRVSTASRWMLPRETMTVVLSMGPVAIKKAVLPDGETRWIPEFESCRRVAREQNMPIRSAYEQIAREASALSSSGATRPTGR